MKFGRAKITGFSDEMVGGKGDLTDLAGSRPKIDEVMAENALFERLPSQPGRLW